MLLFDENKSISIYLKNSNPYVRLAVEDLRADFLRVSRLEGLPSLVEKEEEFCFIIEENTLDNPLQDEGFSLVCDGEKITLSAATYLGTLWGIYTFSEKFLGVQPCYLFNDLAIEKRERLEIGGFAITERPVGIVISICSTSE